jgi:hypothetical protein
MKYMTETDVYNSNQFADDITLNLLHGPFHHVFKKMTKVMSTFVLLLCLIEPNTKTFTNLRAHQR